MSNKKYHVIRVSGQVESSEWKGELEYGAPLYQDMKRILEFSDDSNLERVSVLWQGKLANMFVDERGIAFSRAINLKATRIYWNYSFSKYQRKFIYSDLEKTPVLTADELKQVDGFLSGIYGPAFLWEGKLKW